MEEKLLLYLDILGFSELISEPEKVHELYATIDRLNVFTHKGSFECIVFSDTLLVYNSVPVKVGRELKTAIMWMCEFAQDLFYRLIGKDLHFRALLTKGPFEHRTLENIQSFFGGALVSAYGYENRISCTGLFMDRSLVEHSHIFKTNPYDDNYSYVHVMQNLGEIDCAPDQYPIPGAYLTSREMEYFLSYDIVYLRNLHKHMTNYALPGKVRAKYISAWQMIRTRYPRLLDRLEQSGFDPRFIADLDWSEPMRRVGTPDGFHG